ncbi:DUF2490 domain-containing protein [Hyphomonas sp.]|mgnify:CR=1 FL=1|jgi:hypothetical protein|uniref:DUF2490 domain-containing protein n=1 Tax=Hyphomonas sp. TaxID=87 RepID=UPI00391D0396
MSSAIRTSSLALASAVLITSHAAAQGTDEGFEFWLNPSLSHDLTDRTGVELETAQRWRSAEDGRADTYFYRLWLNHDAAPGVTVSGAVEYRINDGAADETRLMQQVSARHGIWRTRLRLEQRFVENAAQTGLRIRPRLGVSVPLDEAGRWSFKSDAELFVTLQATSPSGDEGLTGLRTQIGFGYKINERLSLSAAYLRQQDFFSTRPDVVGHAPIIAIDYSF